MNKNLEIQGHRGCAGLLPENSIPGFLKAMELGLTSVELDVVISADNQVVVSHEPYFSSVISRNPEGREVPFDKEKSYNLFKMNYEEIKKWDCGTIPHFRFLNQKKIKVYKPLLKEVINTCELYSTILLQSPPVYNIEIKSDPAWDNIFHPDFQTFAEIVLKCLEEININNRFRIKSFDQRILKWVKANYPLAKISLLIHEDGKPENFISQLGFSPDIYSPWYQLMNNEDVKDLQSKGIKVIPWTVNNTEDMKRMMDMGVDGIITDYPDVLKELCSSL